MDKEEANKLFTDYVNVNIKYLRALKKLSTVTNSNNNKTISY